jgi:hypothetical protein
MLSKEGIQMYYPWDTLLVKSLALLNISMGWAKKGFLLMLTRGALNACYWNYC